MLQNLLLLVLSLGWNIEYIDGNNSILSIKENEFRISQKNINAIALPDFDFFLKSGRFSKLFLTKQSLYKPSENIEMIVDEETKVGVFKDNLTFFYGRIFIDFTNVERHSEIISFFGTPFFARISGGKVIIFTSDIGYFLYCIKCEGEIWKQTEKDRFNTETAISVKNLAPRNIFFINDSSAEGELVDDELFSLLRRLEYKILKKGSFSKDILYSHTDEVPKPRIPEKKKFGNLPQTDLERLRHSTLVETICYDLLKSGKSCDIKK